MRKVLRLEVGATDPALLRLAERAHRFLALLARGAIEDQDPVEVVHLVLDDAGLEAGRLDDLGLAPLVERADAHVDRALDVDDLALRAEEIFGPERVVRAHTLPDAIETAIALVEEAGSDGEGLSGAGIVVTGSVVTAGAARTLFGKAPQ